MSLVAYPDSDDEDNDEDNDDNNINNPRLDPTANVSSIATTTTTQRTSATTAVKRPHHELNDLPPLPAAFHDLYSTNARISTTDNPSLHGGRKRAVPHIDGNWPSHVYLEWLPSQTEASQLHNLIRAIQDAIARANKAHAKPLPVPDIIPSLQSELGTPLPLHISLSRTLQIRTEQRDNFLQTLTSCLRRAAVQAVQIRFAGLKWVPNYQGNRWFLVLSIERPPQDELNRLLEACNEAAERCGHPGLYIGGRGDGPMQSNVSPNSTNKRRKNTQHQGDKNSTQQTIDRTDNFHITIAWNLADPTPEWTSLVQHMDVSKYIQSPDATFDAVKAKVGNVIHKVDLGQKKSGLGKGGGILGLG